MGTLVAMRKPTPLALWLADHTYVQCGNGGRAWGCWGSKTGGTELRRANGSTLRADAIASHDEKAGIRCYLINGVCHQSANRILLPAKITVRGARGYRLSEFRFGTYGRPRGRGLFRWCLAPFNTYPNVAGDLPECADAAGPAASPPSPPYPGGGSPRGAGGGSARQPEDPRYLDAILRMYGDRVSRLEGAQQLDGEALVEFMVALFGIRLEFAGVDLGRVSHGQLRDIRAEIERKQIGLEEATETGKLALRDFPKKSEELTFEFQERMLQALKEPAYRELFEIDREDSLKPMGLSDPEIAGPVYGPR